MSQPENKNAGFIFTLREFIGSLGDLGTLLPLLVGLIIFNGIHAGTALVLLGVTYILVGLYFRLPVPVQPLKAMAMIAIATGLSSGQIRAAALWMAGILLVLSVTRLIDRLNEVFPKTLIRGLQLGLGVMMVSSGMKFVYSWPGTLSDVVHGKQAVEAATLLPSGADFISALLLLVLPQIPLTLGNAVIATRDCSIKYFGEEGKRVTAGRLAASIGLGNLAAGVLGGMPICHGAGGMTAHYHLGARSGACGVMVGSLLLLAGLFGSHATRLLSTMPAWMLGLPLVYVGVRHAMLAREAFRNPASASVVICMAFVGYFTGSLLTALVVGLIIKVMLDNITGLVIPEARRKGAVEEE